MHESQGGALHFSSSFLLFPSRLTFLFTKKQLERKKNAFNKKNKRRGGTEGKKEKQERRKQSHLVVSFGRGRLSLYSQRGVILFDWRWFQRFGSQMSKVFPPPRPPLVLFTHLLQTSQSAESPKSQLMRGMSEWEREGGREGRRQSGWLEEKEGERESERGVGGGGGREREEEERSAAREWETEQWAFPYTPF